VAFGRGMHVDMQETAESRLKQDDLWAEALWSLGLVAVVASIIILLSIVAPK
jgi:hypothetical protein